MSPGLGRAGARRRRAQRDRRRPRSGARRAARARAPRARSPLAGAEHQLGAALGEGGGDRQAEATRRPGQKRSLVPRSPSPWNLQPPAPARRPARGVWRRARLARDEGARREVDRRRVGGARRRAGARRAGDRRRAASRGGAAARSERLRLDPGPGDRDRLPPPDRPDRALHDFELRPFGFDQPGRDAERRPRRDDRARLLRHPRRSPARRDPTPGSGSATPPPRTGCSSSSSSAEPDPGDSPRSSAPPTWTTT